MTCNEAIKHFHEFMDKELDKSHYFVVKKHIDNCGDCHKRYKVEVDVRALVKACCNKITAPPYLLDRILKDLDAVHAVTPVLAAKEVSYQQKAPRTLFSSRYYAIAASVLISIAGGIFYYSNYYHHADSITIVDDAVKKSCGSSKRQSRV